MATGLTAEGALLEVNTGDDTTPVWTPVIERSQLTIGKTGDTIDMTTFDTEGFRDFRAGLRTMTINASGNHVPLDTGYDACAQAWEDGAVLQVRASWRTSAPGVTPETRTGWEVDAIVTDIGEDGSVGDKVNSSLSFQAAGKPTVYTDTGV